jgi:hypothetical protein
MKNKKFYYLTCPICGEDLVPSRVEQDGGEHWVYGYTCGCDEEMRSKISSDFIHNLREEFKKEQESWKSA